MYKSLFVDLRCKTSTGHYVRLMLVIMMLELLVIVSGKDVQGSCGKVKIFSLQKIAQRAATWVGWYFTDFIGVNGHHLPSVGTTIHNLQHKFC